MATERTEKNDVDGASMPMANEPSNGSINHDGAPSLSTIPTEVQKILLSHLDWQSLFRMRATNRHYCQIISNDCTLLWKAHHDIRWPNGKRRYNRCYHDYESWSRINGWMIHPQSPEPPDNYYNECMQRSNQIDRYVIQKLAAVKFVGDTHLGGRPWYDLMGQGEDIIDYLKRILIIHEQGERTQHPMDVEGDLTSTIEKVLNGIGRCLAYQEWRFLHDPTVLPRTRVEDGAIVIAKFYDKHDAIIKSPYIHSWENDVRSELDNLADTVNRRLAKRLGGIQEGGKYPILEVIEEMKYLFRTDRLLDDGDDSAMPFRGNQDDYYNHHNSLLNHCIRLRTGIPISLAVIYSAVVRRVCDVTMDVIGLPGHIVVGVPFNGIDNRARVFVDVFNGASVLTYTDCQNIVARYNMTFSDNMLRPISNADVWQRILRNLIHSHSMQAMADDNDEIPDANHEWKIIRQLRFMLADYAARITSLQDLVNSPGWGPQFC